MASAADVTDAGGPAGTRHASSRPGRGLHRHQEAGDRDRDLAVVADRGGVGSRPQVSKDEAVRAGFGGHAASLAGGGELAGGAGRDLLGVSGPGEEAAAARRAFSGWRIVRSNPVLLTIHYDRAVARGRRIWPVEPFMPGARPKLRDPADGNTDSDLGKQWVRQVGVLAACHYPARRPAARR